MGVRQEWGKKMGTSLSRKLRVVARRAMQRSKALVETHLTHALHFKINVTCQDKVMSNVFTFLALGIVTRTAKSSNSPKVFFFCLGKLLPVY